MGIGCFARCCCRCCPAGEAGSSSKKKKKRPGSPQASKSLHSFRDIIPQDNRLDLNSATEQQLHTLPGLTQEMAKAIIQHRIKLNESGREFGGVQDLVLVEGVSCEHLGLLRPEVKVVPMSERRMKGYRMRSKRPVKNGMALHVGYWKLENNAGSFTQDYVENLGVTEVVVSFLLRNSIDIMIFQAKRLGQFADKFDKMINELNEPNLPRTSLTQNRGTWKTKLVTIAKKVKTVNATTSVSDESKPLLNGTVTLKADDAIAYIIAVNTDVVELTDRNKGTFEFTDMVNSLMKLSIVTGGDSKRELSLGFSSKLNPDLLVNGSPSTDDYGPAEATVKTVSTIRSTLRYDQHVELLRNELIPKEWNTSNRVSCTKPELTEVTIES